MRFWDDILDISLSLINVCVTVLELQKTKWHCVTHVFIPLRQIEFVLTMRFLLRTTSLKTTAVDWSTYAYDVNKSYIATYLMSYWQSIIVHQT